MGLELVELVMEIEDEFNLVIPDSDASKIETVGSLYAYLVERLGTQIVSPCPTAVAFYKVRSALLAAGVAGRNDIRPDSDLAHWFAADSGAWNFFRQTLGLGPRLPPMEPTMRRMLQILLAATGSATILLVLLACVLRERQLPALSLATLTFTAFVVMASCFANHLPQECSTVRGFIRHYEPALTPISDPMIWQRVVAIVSEQLGIDSALIRPDSHFIRDLHAG